jgi:sugar lactone lactonase YvrE
MRWKLPILGWLTVSFVLAPDGGRSEDARTPAAPEAKKSSDAPAEQTAQFSQPRGIAIDARGVLYVADTDNHTIRKITPTGVVTTLAGAPGVKGSADGRGNVARFDSPCGIAVDSEGNLYVADSNNHTIRKITSQGVVATLAGAAGTKGTQDGTTTTARFDNPYGIAMDRVGNTYVTDKSDDTIRKISPTGAVTTLAKAGKADSEKGAVRFANPRGIAVDDAGNVYFCDGHNNTVRKITPAGIVSILAGTDEPPETKSIEFDRGFGKETQFEVIPRDADGKGTAAGFNSPGGITIDPKGGLVVADSGNGTIRRVTLEGVVTTLVGSPKTVLGSGSAVRLSPEGVVVDKAGNCYATSSNFIVKIDPTGEVITIAGEAARGSADGAGCVARFKAPEGVAVDDAGVVYVADRDNELIRKVDPNGLVRTVAGLPGSNKDLDGRANVASFWGVNGIVLDKYGNIYVSDSLAHTIRKITPDGMVSTLAGKAGEFGSADGPGNMARFDNPHGLTMDALGNIFVADGVNCTIRKISPDGDVTTIAGSPREQGMTDGKGSAARFVTPEAVAVNAQGNIYVADGKPGAIRLISPDGTVTSLADVHGKADEHGKLPRFHFGWPNSLAIDEAGNVYVADLGDETVRKIARDGTVTTVAGKSQTHGAIDGKGSDARFYTPTGIALDRKGNLYLAEMRNHTIRRITPEGVVTTVAGKFGEEGMADGLAHAPVPEK